MLHEPYEILIPDARVEPSSSGVLNMAERAAAALLLIIAGPILIGCALVIVCLSRRTPLIAHLRVGQGGRPFWMLKLRTMWGRPSREFFSAGLIERIEAEPRNGRKDPTDPRVASRFAAFCRRHSIDELPQLWHVVRGEMSFVGPRPLTRSEILRHYGADADELLSVRPGLTGLWQTSGRSSVGFPRRAALDLENVRDHRRSTYFRLILKTIPALVRGSGAW